MPGSFLIAFISLVPGFLRNFSSPILLPMLPLYRVMRALFVPCYLNCRNVSLSLNALSFCVGEGTEYQERSDGKSPIYGSNHSRKYIFG